MSQTDGADGTSSADQETGIDQQRIANAHGALDVVRTTSATVDAQLDDIESRTNDQAAATEDVQADISDLSASIEEIAATTAEVSNRSERATEKALEGKQSAQEAIEVMEDIRAVGMAVLEEVQTLQEQVAEVSTALDGIDHIADQTNMLALNASIEAARAGESGNGFRVVAEEVKSLAEEAQAQSAEIDDVLSDVQTATDRTADRMEQAISEIERGSRDVESAMDSFDTVAEAIEHTAEDVQTVASTTDDQAAASERLADRIEGLADRSDAIERDVAGIREARSEQTAMLGEIDEVLDAAATGRSQQYADATHVPTGVEALDSLCAGGLPVGSRGVLQHDSDAPVGPLLATLCATALDNDYAVSVTPPPDLDRETLAAGLEAVGRSLDAELRADRLFVLDAFGTWRERYNVFDLEDVGLGAANEATDERRDRPLVVVGNIAGEIAVMGERAAREARYENDDGVLTDADTVLNVVDTGRVGERFGAFYTGAADLVLRVRATTGGQSVSVTAAPTVPAIGPDESGRRLRGPRP